MEFLIENYKSSLGVLWAGIAIFSILIIWQLDKTIKFNKRELRKLKNQNHDR